MSRVRLLALSLLLVTPAIIAQSINLTPEQLAQLQALSAEQRQVFLTNRGSSSGAQPQLVQPIEILPRTVNSSSQDGIAENADSRLGQESLAQDIQLQETGALLEQFGYSLFAGSPTTFAPATDIPVPANYIMGPGDTVILQLYGQQNVTHELVITREGMMLFPEIGPIAVAGLNFNELRAQINEIVSSQLIGQRAAVTLGALRSIRIFVLGEAYRPGSYTVSSLSTMTNALLVSGGITNVGSLRHVQLRRQGETVSELDLYDLLLQGDTSADVRLLPDDVLFIPPIGNTVGIAGEVIRPAIYELREERTVEEVVALSGGLLPTAFLGASRIERIDARGNRTLIDVDLATTEGQQLGVSNGDVIQVYSILDRLENVVLTEGHLRRPGGFQWREGLRISDVIPSLGALLPNPDTRYALVITEFPPTGILEVERVNLFAAITNPGSVDDLILQPRDRIVTFAANGDRQQSITTLLEELNAQARFDAPAAVVSVQGSVRFPGDYPLLRSMTISDLLDSASGLLENADVRYGLLVRNRDTRGNIEVISAIDSSRTGIDHDRSLQAGDALYIFNAGGGRDELLDSVITQLRTQADSIERSRLVKVSGQVKFPGEYPLVNGMTVEDLILASGGYTESALIGSAEITRYYVNGDSGRQVDHLNINLNSSGALGQNLRLAEFDNLSVKQLPNWTNAETVEISGEVISPGIYSISKGDTFSSVLARAGGLTSFADANASILLRATLRERERELLDQYEEELQSDIAAVALGDAGDEGEQTDVLEVGQRLLKQVADAEPLGRLIIDLPLLIAGATSEDVIARNGDQLFIPRTRQEISIMGEVGYPTSHLYNPDLSVSDYIDLSGGLTQRSDAGRTYIIKANGRVVSYNSSRWFFEKESTLEAGDTIVVPFDVEPTNYLVTWSSVSQILFNLATSVLAIESVGN